MRPTLSVRPIIGWGIALGRALADWYVFAVLSIPTLWVGAPFPVRRAPMAYGPGGSPNLSALFFAQLDDSSV